MKNFVYKKSTVTSMKVAGYYDAKRMTIDVDGEAKSLKKLLSDFEGACIEISVKVKDKMELDEPTGSEET